MFFLNLFIDKIEYNII